MVEYFDQGAKEGLDQYTYEYEGAKFKFSCEENRETFIQNPKKYLPQYRGWCAYAMAIDGSKVTIDPKTFEVREGKLYLFYNKFFTNTYESWLDEDPQKLRQQADEHWAKKQ